MTSSLKQNAADMARLPGEGYYEYLDRLAAGCTRIIFTDEENLQIMKDLSKGMTEFLWEEKKIRKETILEFKDLILD